MRLVRARLASPQEGAGTVTGPSSAPRGEHTPRPGITWTTTVGWSGEQLVDDDAPDPRPNRETRRAMKRAARRQK